MAEGDLGLVGEDGGAARAPLGMLLTDALLREGLDLELLDRVRVRVRVRARARARARARVRVRVRVRS